MNAIVREMKQATANRLSSSHIAGSELKDALALAEAIAVRGWKTTLCPWEGPSDTSSTMSERYRQALWSIRVSRLDGALSLKLPSLNFCCESIHSLAELAAECNVQLRFDAQDFENASKTLDMVESVRLLYSDIVCTIPARWQRSKTDIERVVAMQAGVRIVKGQWAGPGELPNHFRERFLELVDIVAGRAQFVAIATHDRSLAAEAIGRLRQTETPCEIEQMLGLPSNGPELSQRFRIPTRLYIPYGCGYIPYNRSDMWHRPEIARWLMRDLLLNRKAKLAQIL
ncbi:MAG TPA: hypothetical protein VMM58_06670 [Bacteroidota bacterium]|nr:hypothetical protein [Bacteroidota bacterium]